MLLPELPAVAVPVLVAPAVAVELPVRERIAGPLGALGTAVPVLLVRRLVQLSFGETNKHPRTAVPVLLVRRLVLLPPAATVAALQAVATWSAVAFAELPFAEQVAGTEAVPSKQLAAEVRTVPVPELRQLDPGTRRR